MLSMCLFSVIIPSFNRADVIGRAIESVLLQSCKNFELIIIDDGSTDKTSENIRMYLSNPAVHYYYQPNAGVCAARNYGAAVSKGKYLIFLDSDDTVTVNWLSDFSKLFDSGNYNIAFCSVKEQSSDGSFRVKHTKESSCKSKRSGNYTAGSFCISRYLFLQAGGYDSYILYGENTELGFRLSGHNLQIGSVHNPNLFYRASVNGGSKNWKNKLESTLYILEKHKLMFKQEKRVKGLYYGVAALAAFKCDKPALARSLFFKSFLSYPLSWKSLLRLTVSLYYPLAKRQWG